MDFNEPHHYVSVSKDAYYMTNRKVRVSSLWCAVLDLCWKLRKKIEWRMWIGRRKKETCKIKEEEKSEWGEVGRKEGGRTGERERDRGKGGKEGGRRDGEERGRAGKQEGIVTCLHSLEKLMAVHGIRWYSSGDGILEGRQSMISLQTPVLF